MMKFKRFTLSVLLGLTLVACGTARTEQPSSPDEIVQHSMA